jgi:hypothetical protein
VLPRHPQAVGCEDTSITVCVRRLEGRGCATPLMALDDYAGLEGSGYVLCDICLEGVKNGLGWVVGNGDLQTVSVSGMR